MTRAAGGKAGHSSEETPGAAMRWVLLKMPQIHGPGATCIPLKLTHLSCEMGPPLHRATGRRHREHGPHKARMRPPAFD